MSEPGSNIVWILERKKPSERTFWPLGAGIFFSYRKCRQTQREREQLYPENQYRVTKYESVRGR